MTGLAGGIESTISSHRNEPAPESHKTDSESANVGDCDALVFVIPVESDGRHSSDERPWPLEVQDAFTARLTELIELAHENCATARS